MGGEILLQSAFCQVVVCQRTSPHNLGAVSIVFGVGKHFKDAVLHGAQQRLGNGVGQRHVFILREVALHGVHHDIGSTCCRLIGWQGVGQLRIHNAEAATAQVAVDAALQQSFVAGDNATVGHLAACCGNGQYDADRQTGLRRGLAGPEVPHIAVVAHAIADGLGRVDNASATYGEDEVYLFAATEFNAFVDLRQQRVGDDATQLDKADASLTQSVEGAVEQTGTTG